MDVVEHSTHARYASQENAYAQCFPAHVDPWTTPRFGVLQVGWPGKREAVPFCLADNHWG